MFKMAAHFATVTEEEIYQMNKEATYSCKHKIHLFC